MPADSRKRPTEPTFEGDKTLPWNFWGRRTILFFFHDFWFRVAAFGFVFLVLFLGLFLPKIWEVSPKGFLPVIKISGLDVVQAWQLRRTALEQAAAGQMQESMQAWRGAILNTPCDPEMHRGMLQTLIQQNHPNREFMGIGVHGAGWLLRLTNTNTADVDIVSAFYEKYENYDWVVRNLAREGSTLSPEMAKRLLRASFVRGDMAQFGALWKQYEPSVGSDKAMQVYFNAWRSGWGLPRESREGRALLEMYLQDPEHRLLAHQLRLPVAYAQADLKGYEESLRFLHEQNADRINQQVDYWRLLDHVHRKEDAIRAAKGFVVPPSTPLETINMATTFAQLGLDDDAIKFLEKGTRDFPWNPDLWSLLGSTLAKQKRWDDLRTLALNLRVDPVARESIGGLAYYLEGLAHWNTHHEAMAVAAFEKVPTLPFDSPLRAFTTAMALNRLGQSGPATLLLKQAEGAFTNTASFYFELTVASFQARQSEALLQAAEKAYQLNPNNLGYANNFAAALICTRQRSAEALQLTFRLLNVNPNNPDAQINHALALCQNARYSEAADLLNGINQNQLLPDAVNALQLALFEIHIGQGHYAEARRVHDLIVPNLLFPNQAQWVREALSRLPTNKG